MVKFVYGPVVEQFFLSRRVFLAHPFRVAGVYKSGDLMVVPKETSVEKYSTMPPRRFLSMGAFSYCMSVELHADTLIGRYCSIAKGVRVMGINHPTDRITTHVFSFRDYARRFLELEFGRMIDFDAFSAERGRVSIGNDVWIGEGVLMSGGISLGDGCCVAAGAVVTRDVPPYAIVAGVPAKLIRSRFDVGTIEELLELQWWKYNFADFEGLPLGDVSAFVRGLRRRIENGEISELKPCYIDVERELTEYIGEVADGDVSLQAARASET